MMINNNYANIVEQTKTQTTPQLNTEQSSVPKPPPSAAQDTVTLSKQAQDLLQGTTTEVKEIAPTYKKPQAASELIASDTAVAKTPSTATPSILLDKVM